MGLRFVRRLSSYELISILSEYKSFHTKGLCQTVGKFILISILFNPAGERQGLQTTGII